MSFHDDYKPAPDRESRPIDRKQAAIDDARWGAVVITLAVLAVVAVIAMYAASDPRDWKMLLGTLPFLVLAGYGWSLRAKRRLQATNSTDS